jgi:hypothetical protein
MKLHLLSASSCVQSPLRLPFRAQRVPERHSISIEPKGCRSGIAYWRREISCIIRKVASTQMNHSINANEPTRGLIIVRGKNCN